MKHNITVSLRRAPPGERILCCRKLTVRERFLRLLFGGKIAVTLIVPGKNVDCISIQEVKEGGASDE